MFVLHVRLMLPPHCSQENTIDEDYPNVGPSGQQRVLSIDENVEGKILRNGATLYRLPVLFHNIVQTLNH